MPAVSGEGGKSVWPAEIALPEDFDKSTSSEVTMGDRKTLILGGTTALSRAEIRTFYDKALSGWSQADGTMQAGKERYFGWKTKGRELGVSITDQGTERYLTLSYTRLSYTRLS